MLDGSDQTFSFNSSAFISIVFDTEISGLQYARALSTVSGYRGYGAEQGNMVDWHFFFFILYFTFCLSEWCGEVLQIYSLLVTLNLLIRLEVIQTSLSLIFQGARFIYATPI